MTHGTHGLRSSRRRALRLEPLEGRELLSTGPSFVLLDASADVSPKEQLLVYELNRARHDPVAYQNEQNLPVDLSYVAARPPLAINDSLFNSAEFHAVEMATHDYFGHQSEVTGDWPNKMARDHGYELPSSWPDDDNYIESIAAGYATTLDALNGLIVDEGVPSLGHRNHLLGITDFSADDREIGVGYAYNNATPYRHYWAIHATRRDPSDTFLTGVAFDDLNGNGRYDFNEGLPGVTVTAGEQATTTNAAGGWSLQVTAGTYTVTASGAAFGDTAGSTVLLDGESLEIDFVSGRSWGIVDFNDTSPPPVASDDRYTAYQNAMLTVPPESGVLIDDTGDRPLSAVIVHTTSHGELSFNADGSFVYVPEADFHGTDSFTYRAQQRQVLSDVATVTIPVARRLETIDFLELSQQNPSAGDLWYHVRSTRPGFFTLEASVAEPGGSAEIALYDLTFNLLATSTPIDGNPRIDHQAAAAGETFYFRMTGTSAEVDLRLANLVQTSPDGTQLTAYGTGDDDTFRAIAGAPFVTVINGIRYESSLVADAQFLGGGGSDSTTFHGSDGDETVTVYPHSGSVTGPGYQVQLADVASMTVYGGGGADLMELYDSAGDDSFVGTPTYAAMQGDGFFHQARDFAEVRAEATSGGTDVAKFYDSAGNDSYVATPTYNAVSGDGFHNQIRDFEGVHVYATAGGVDVAKFYDSAGNDDFVAAPTYAALFGEGFYNRAKYFEGVHAYATVGGADLARFYDSPANDDFVATPTYAALYNVSYQQEYTNGFYNRAKFFEGAHAYATAGGVDLARLYDSPDDDKFYADPTQGALYNDTYEEEHTSGFYNRVKFFDGVHAYATADGTDVAHLHGSDENDKFYHDPSQCAAYLPGEYYNRAKYFEENYAYAHQGDQDQAELHDSALDDLLEAEGSWARLTHLDSGAASWIQDFDYVKAIATEGTNRKDVVSPLDFDLEWEGPWEDL